MVTVFHEQYPADEGNNAALRDDIAAVRQEVDELRQEVVTRDIDRPNGSDRGCLSPTGVNFPMPAPTRPEP